MLKPKGTLTLIFFALVIACNALQSRKGPGINPSDSNRNHDLSTSIRYVIAQVKSVLRFRSDKEQCSYIRALINELLTIKIPNCSIVRKNVTLNSTPVPKPCPPCKKPVIPKCEPTRIIVQPSPGDRNNESESPNSPKGKPGTIPPPGHPNTPVSDREPSHQYPGYYPPGHYPPGNYPPGNYPPGNYPPGNYPPGKIIPVGPSPNDPNTGREPPHHPGYYPPGNYPPGQIPVRPSPNDPNTGREPPHHPGYYPPGNYPPGQIPVRPSPNDPVTGREPSHQYPGHYPPGTIPPSPNDPNTSRDPSHQYPGYPGKNGLRPSDTYLEDAYQRPGSHPPGQIPVRPSPNDPVTGREPSHQYPGHYPPGHYPPGHYPPGTIPPSPNDPVTGREPSHQYPGYYPPGNYPPGTIPPSPNDPVTGREPSHQYPGHYPPGTIPPSPNDPVNGREPSHQYPGYYPPGQIPNPNDPNEVPRFPFNLFDPNDRRPGSVIPDDNGFLPFPHNPKQPPSRYPGGVIYFRPPHADVVRGASPSNTQLEFNITPGIIVYEGILITPDGRQIQYILYITVRLTKQEKFIAGETLIPQDLLLQGILRIPELQWTSPPFDLNKIIPTYGFTINTDALQVLLMSILPRNLGPSETIKIIFPNIYQLNLNFMTGRIVSMVMLVPGLTLHTQIKHYPQTMEYVITFPGFGQHIQTFIDILMKARAQRDLVGINLDHILNTLRVNPRGDIIFRLSSVGLPLRTVTEQLREVVTYIMVRFFKALGAGTLVQVNPEIANPTRYPSAVPSLQVNTHQLGNPTRYPSAVPSLQVNAHQLGNPTRYPSAVPSVQVIKGPRFGFGAGFQSQAPGMSLQQLIKNQTTPGNTTREAASPQGNVKKDSQPVLDIIRDEYGHFGVTSGKPSKISIKAPIEVLKRKFIQPPSIKTYVPKGPYVQYMAPMYVSKSDQSSLKLKMDPQQVFKGGMFQPGSIKTYVSKVPYAQYMAPMYVSKSNESSLKLKMDPLQVFTRNMLQPGSIKTFLAQDAHGQYMAPMYLSKLDDPSLKSKMDGLKAFIGNKFPPKSTQVQFSPRSFPDSETPNVNGSSKIKSHSDAKESVSEKTPSSRPTESSHKNATKSVNSVKPRMFDENATKVNKNKDSTVNETTEKVIKVTERQTSAVKTISGTTSPLPPRKDSKKQEK